MEEKKEKKYLSDNAQLMAEWNYEKNSDLKPEDCTVSSNKKAWWRCAQGHEWQTTISHRSNGRGCPFCSGKRVIKGTNDLQTINPSLAEEWNYDKNEGLTPTDVLPNSNKNVWWICKEGHEWQSQIYNRNIGNRCPYCSGRKVLSGYNDLQTVNSHLATEWNYEKNGNLKPSNFTANSGKKVWWKCKKGHEWQAVIGDRNNGKGCPICDSERHTSFPEYALAYYLNKHGLEVIHSYKEKGYELDIFIPSSKIAIEYDGYYWHKSKMKKDLEKNKKCKNDGIKLYRIREGLMPLDDSSIDYVVRKDQKDLSIILEKVLSEIIGLSINVDLIKDGISIENLREFTEKEESFLLSNPEIAQEWNYEKNGHLKPENVTPNSDKMVWWKCVHEHEWQAIIGNRNKGSGCPYCSGKKVLKGYNDLLTVNPMVAIEWDYEKNGELKPENFTSNSGEKVWWRCGKGHEWQATINNRSNGTGCPYCSNKKVLIGYNDLQTINPTLAQEWNHEKNGELKPENFTSNSGTLVWWKCVHGHEWQAKIMDRNKGNRCPYCSGKRVLKGKNDLQTVNPTLAKEWNHAKNGELTPMDVMPNSDKKVWWLCSKGHEWQATIGHRNKGRGCPECARLNRKKHI